MNNVIKHCGSAGERQTGDALNTADLDATKVERQIGVVIGASDKKGRTITQMLKTMSMVGSLYRAAAEIAQMQINDFYLLWGGRVLNDMDEILPNDSLVAFMQRLKGGMQGGSWSGADQGSAAAHVAALAETEATNAKEWLQQMLSMDQLSYDQPKASILIQEVLLSGPKLARTSRVERER